MAVLRVLLRRDGTIAGVHASTGWDISWGHSHALSLVVKPVAADSNGQEPQ
jgi:hypothetical protein